MDTYLETAPNQVQHQAQHEADVQRLDRLDRTVSWVASAGFPDLGAAERVIDALAGASLEVGQVCILGAPEHVSDLGARLTQVRPHRQPQSASDRAYRPGGEADALSLLVDGREPMAAKGNLDILDFEAERRADGLLYGVEAAIDAGCVFLLVEARSQQELELVVRHLLRHSSQRVRMREASSR